MIQRDENDIAPVAEVHTVVERVVSRAAAVGAAVNVNHHRPLAAIAQAWGPDIEIEAVFADRAKFRRKMVTDVAAAVPGGLRRSGPKASRLANTRPGCGRRWGHKPAQRRIGPVWNAFEDVNSAVYVSAHTSRRQGGFC